MEWVTVIITNVVQPSKTAFGVREDNGENVFIPPSVSKTLGLEVSDIVLAKLVPNNDQSNRDNTRSRVPWFAPLMARSIDDLMEPDEVKAALLEFDYPVTAEEAEIASAALQQAYQEGKITKIIVMPSPRDERIIMWAADMDRV
jgi:hypothetical protein